MSASAGKVMPRPMGEYNGATEYKILDIVTYNDRPYMAKQTTTGNLPTNTTYWMLLLDFPTLVDDAPTQNSQNLVYSGGVYNSLANKMDADGSNVETMLISDALGDYSMSAFYVDSITKDAGVEQDVIMVKAVTDGNAENLFAKWKAYVGADLKYNNGTADVHIIIDSVSLSTSTVTITAHLKEDDSAAIAISSTTAVGAPVRGYYAENKYPIVGVGARLAANADRTVLGGLGSAVSADYAVAFGKNCAVSGECGVATGDSTTAKGAKSSAAGTNTVAGYANQFVVGKNNSNKSGTLFEVGSGTGATSRVNAFEVYSDATFSQNNGTDKYKFAKSGGIDGFYDGSNNFHPFYKELVNNSVTLSTSADTTVTFTDSAITANSTIEPFTSVYSIAPKDCVASAGQCVVTIPKQSTAQTIKVKIRVS